MMVFKKRRLIEHTICAVFLVDWKETILLKIGLIEALLCARMMELME